MTGGMARTGAKGAPGESQDGEGSDEREGPFPARRRRRDGRQYRREAQNEKRPRHVRRTTSEDTGPQRGTCHEEDDGTPVHAAAQRSRNPCTASMLTTAVAIATSEVADGDTGLAGSRAQTWMARAAAAAAPAPKSAPQAPR